MPQPRENASTGFLDSIVHGFADAVADIRHKVVEEGWFGKQVTDVTPTMEVAAPSEPVSEDWKPRRQSFDEQWAVREPTIETPAVGRDIPDQGIDL